MRFDDDELRSIAERVAAVLLPRLVAALGAAAPPLEPTYMRIADFAARHSVSTRTVKAWLAAGMPAVRPTRRVVRVVVVEADRWLRDGGQQARVVRRAAADAARRTARGALRVVGDEG